jgi:prepilin-type N-terminal cleavage/methylation domain-containing protein
MRDRGYTLVELVAVMGAFAVMATVAIPSYRGWTNDAHIRGAARIFQGEFRKARSMAIRRSRYTAIRFERRERGADFSLYVDGNGNGVRSADIEDGIDARIAGPFPLHGHAPTVRVGINQGVPAIEGGALDPEDPIRFGRSDILSFSPMGTSTPGTFYLAGDAAQGAVRVTNNGRVRLLIWHGTWQED